jgi:hypothetical protein
MDYQFNFGWMVAGLAITLAGALVVIFYRPIAENLANGVSSYEKVKLFGIIAVVIGLLTTSNLLLFVFDLLFGFLFKH